MHKKKTIPVNIAANYISFFYTSGIGFVVTPLLYHAVGAAGYGLIGFYAVLQAWFVMLDFGLSATMSRVCSRYKAGAIPDSEMLNNFRVIERIFLLIGGIGAILIIIAAEPIAAKWFDLTGNLYSQATTSIAIMGIVVAFRWGSGLYRGILNGVERQVTASGLNVIGATFRFPLAYICVVIWGLDIQGFFLLQAAISIMEFGILRLLARSELPKSNDSKSEKMVVPETIFRFSAGVFWVGLTNTAVMQIDKIIISKKIGLEDFGEFSLVIVLVNVIGMASGPIASALIPALSRVYAENRPYAFYVTYSKYWQICVIFVGAIVAMFITNSYSILNVWVNDADVATKFANPMVMYSLGNLMFSMASYVHYLQFATGNLSLQLRYNTIFILIYLPLMMIAVVIYGVDGAAFVWAVCSSLGFVYITYAVHCRLMRPSYLLWMKRYFVNGFVAMLMAAALFSFIVRSVHTKTATSSLLILATLLVVATGLISSKNIRRHIKYRRNSNSRLLTKK